MLPEMEEMNMACRYQYPQWSVVSRLRVHVIMIMCRSQESELLGEGSELEHALPC